MEEKKENMQTEVKTDTVKDDVAKNGVTAKCKDKLAEWGAMILFVVLSVVLFIYHEPWYDEIQAWMVATDASIGEMIWQLPHFEGHPPFWTLILALFAKTGVPMEIGLRIPTLLFFKDGKVALRAENHNYSPHIRYIYPKDLTIQGVALKVIKDIM